MKKFAAFLIAALFATSAYASGASYTLGMVDSRDTQASGSVVNVTVQSDNMNYSLESLNVANTNRTEAGATYTLFDVVGFTGKIGAGAVAQTAARTHLSYNGSVAYAYDFQNRWSAGAGIGYKNDLNRSVLDRQVTYTAKASYLLDGQGTSLDGAFTRTNGDLRINTISLTCNTRF